MFLAIGIIAIVLAIAIIVHGYIEEVTWEKIVAIILILIGIVAIAVHFNTAQGKRALKDWTSNASGGLERSVEVYDQSGKLIRTYEGKLDVQENEYGNKVLFDLNGKRTIIYNATVIVQEK